MPLNAAVVMEPAPKFQGSLEKQGRMKTWSWRKYWFVLKEGQLTYVKKQDKLACQGHIDLTQAITIRTVSGNRGYPFEIVTKSRTHFLSADSLDIRDKWLKLLHESMAWSARFAFRTGAGSSTRASCNSLDEDDDSVSGSVSSMKSSGSPSTSSGYGSTSSNRASGTNIRDSGTEDLMFLNTNYTKKEDALAMSSNETVKGTRSISSDNDDSSVIYDDIEPTDSQGHQGLRRLSQMKSLPGSSDLPESLVARDSTMSDIYDEVKDPLANIAISHIVKGYANIARNKGTQQQVAEMSASAKDESEPEDLYDEVFDSLKRDSKVVMRKSVQRNSEFDNGYSQTADSLLVNPDRIASCTSNVSVSELYSQVRNTGVALPIRKSMLPDDIQSYFHHDPIPNLPHPRMELTHCSTFDDIRRFLANNRGPNEVFNAQRNNDSCGEAVDNLLSYLKVIA